MRKTFTLTATALVLLAVLSGCPNTGNNNGEPAATFTVTFDTGGGSTVAAVPVEAGTKVARPANPTRTGLDFKGWFLPANPHEPFGFDTPISGDTTIVADWGTAGLEYGLNDDGDGHVVTGPWDLDVETLVVPNFHDGLPVTAVGKWAFNLGDDPDYKGNQHIRHVIIGANVVVIEEAAFARTVTESVTFPVGSRLKTIGWVAFWDTNLTSITIPASVISIGDAAFYDSGITNITFVAGSRLEIIGVEAFAFINLASITMPTSVASVGSRVFRGWTAEQTIYIPHDTLTPEGWNSEWRYDCDAKVYNNLTNPPTQLFPVP